MRVYIWEEIEKCTDNYHSEGGVVVFAKSLKRARELANAISGCKISEGEKPDHSRGVSGGKEDVYIFPNAGCC